MKRSIDFNKRFNGIPLGWWVGYYSASFMSSRYYKGTDKERGPYLKKAVKLMEKYEKYKS